MLKNLGTNTEGKSGYFTSKDGLNCVKHVILGEDDNLSVMEHIND
jgi:hypothetical protein